jgi:hypothetical protein
MTTLNQARERIYQQFVTDGGLVHQVTLTFDNDDFDPPEGTPWARLSVRHRASTQESLGGVGLRKFERIGAVIVQCFVPLDKGTQAADTLATAARNVFEGKTFTPEAIHFFDVVVREIGPDDAWYQVNVEAFFIYHETK